ncbi:hypothetical protein [uncultured Eubacterium sp.]|uniref:hypothetical protein n=1 Tax=uncultured Eubacterium sp. TaxID=165185 RepID=UPI0025CF35FE|nr:hypothetical protein [uncultured Eubacterium sp.]
MNKKAISIILCAFIIICSVAFASCSKQESKAETASAVATEKAKIKDADAINYIESYSSKQLGLTDEEKKTCSFMVASDGEEINGKSYIQVIAAIKKEHKSDDGQATYTFDTKGEYYISFNGDEVLRKDGNSYTKLELITTTAKENE